MFQSVVKYKVINQIEELAGEKVKEKKERKRTATVTGKKDWTSADHPRPLQHLRVPALPPFPNC